MRLSLDRKEVNVPLVSACVLAAKDKILAMQNKSKKITIRTTVISKSQETTHFHQR